MKSKLCLIILLVLGANMALAQETEIANDTVASKKVVVDSAIFPRAFIGIRGGANLSSMTYSFAPINQYYEGHMQVQGLAGIFAHFYLGKSNFAIRPEVSYIGRANKLTWLDVNYRMKADYVDFRLPITYNIKFKNKYFAPYLMVAPQYDMAIGGEITYVDDFQKANVDITEADIQRFDGAVLFGIGFDYLIRTSGIPVLFSFEAGYNMGFHNTFADREILDNPTIDDPSVIANPFHGAELWQGTRKNRGIEVAMRLALPIDGSWRKKKAEDDNRGLLYARPDTVYITTLDTIKTVKVDTVKIVRTDTVYVGRTETVVVKEPVYVRKDCISLHEMEEALLAGESVKDKRICMFNINFDFDKHDLLPQSIQPLKELANFLTKFKDIKIQVYGHTDNRGSDEYNLGLSKDRAMEVCNFLNSLGVDIDRMTPVGYGEAYPYVPNTTDHNRFLNRRVEIEIEELGIKVTEQATEIKK